MIQNSKSFYTNCENIFDEGYLSGFLNYNENYIYSNTVEGVKIINKYNKKIILKIKVSNTIGISINVNILIIGIITGRIIFYDLKKKIYKDLFIDKTNNKICINNILIYKDVLIIGGDKEILIYKYSNLDFIKEIRCNGANNLRIYKNLLITNKHYSNDITIYDIENQFNLITTINHSSKVLGLNVFKNYLIFNDQIKVLNIYKFSFDCKILKLPIIYNDFCDGIILDIDIDTNRLICCKKNKVSFFNLSIINWLHNVDFKNYFEKDNKIAILKKTIEKNKKDIIDINNELKEIISKNNWNKIDIDATNLFEKDNFISKIKEKNNDISQINYDIYLLENTVIKNGEIIKEKNNENALLDTDIYNINCDICLLENTIIKNKEIIMKKINENDFLNDNIYHNNYDIDTLDNTIENYKGKIKEKNKENVLERDNIEQNNYDIALLENTIEKNKEIIKEYKIDIVLLKDTFKHNNYNVALLKNIIEKNKKIIKEYKIDIVLLKDNIEHNYNYISLIENIIAKNKEKIKENDIKIDLKGDNIEHNNSYIYLIENTIAKNKEKIKENNIKIALIKDNIENNNISPIENTIIKNKEKNNKFLRIRNKFLKEKFREINEQNKNFVSEIYSISKKIYKKNKQNKNSEIYNISKKIYKINKQVLIEIKNYSKDNLNNLENTTNND